MWQRNLRQAIDEVEVTQVWLRRAGLASQRKEETGRFGRNELAIALSKTN